MFLHPCRKCVVLACCTQDCDDIRKWNNIRRIWKETSHVFVRCCLAASLLVIIFGFLIKCMGMRAVIW